MLEIILKMVEGDSLEELGFTRISSDNIDRRAGRIFYNSDLDILVAADPKIANYYGGFEYLDKEIVNTITMPEHNLDLLWVENASGCGDSRILDLLFITDEN